MTGVKQNHNKANHHMCADTGSGAAIVIVPGLPGTHDWFKYQSAGLADRYRVLVCDWPNTMDARYDVQELEATVLAAMDDIGVRTAAIVGYQMGGAAALRIAVDHPERTAALIMASALPGPFYRNENELAIYVSPPGTEPEGLWTRIKKALTGRSAETKPVEQSVDETQLPSAPLTKLAMKSIIRDFSRVDERPLAESVDVPTLILAGSREPDFVLAAAGFLKKNIEPAEMEIIEGAEKHYFYTMNDKFNNLIQDFLTHRVASF